MKRQTGRIIGRQTNIHKKTADYRLAERQKVKKTNGQDNRQTNKRHD
jgi:hypothetical protein